MTGLVSTSSLTVNRSSDPRDEQAPLDALAAKRTTKLRFVKPKPSEVPRSLFDPVDKSGLFQVAAPPT